MSTDLYIRDMRLVVDSLLDTHKNIFNSIIDSGVSLMFLQSTTYNRETLKVSIKYNNQRS